MSVPHVNTKILKRKQIKIHTLRSYKSKSEERKRSEVPE